MNKPDPPALGRHRRAVRGAAGQLDLSAVRPQARVAERDGRRQPPHPARRLLPRARRDPRRQAGRRRSRAGPTTSTSSSAPTRRRGVRPVTGFYSYSYGAPTGIEQPQNDVLVRQRHRLFVSRVVDLLTGPRPQGGNVELTIDPKAQKAAYGRLSWAATRGRGRRARPQHRRDPRDGHHPTTTPTCWPATTSTRSTQAWEELNDDQAKPLHQPRHPDDATRRARRSSWSPPRPPSRRAVRRRDRGARAGRARPAADPTTTCQRRRRRLRPATDHPDPGARGLLQHHLRLLGHRARRRRDARAGREVRLRRRARRSRCGHPEHHSRRDERAADARCPRSASSTSRATPLQMAMVAAGDRQRRRRDAPYLVDEVRSARPRRSSSQHRPAELSQAVLRRRAAQLTKMMVAVVDDGTGTPAADPGRRGRRQDRHRPARLEDRRRTPGSSRSRRPTTRRSPSRCSSRTAASPRDEIAGGTRRGPDRQGGHGGGDQPMSRLSSHGAVRRRRRPLPPRLAGSPPAGMGEVWRATDTVLGRDVAVKVLKRGVRRRRRASAPGSRPRPATPPSLHHPGIAAVFDYGEATRRRVRPAPTS